MDLLKIQFWPTLDAVLILGILFVMKLLDSSCVSLASLTSLSSLSLPVSQKFNSTNQCLQYYPAARAESTVVVHLVVLHQVFGEVSVESEAFLSWLKNVVDVAVQERRDVRVRISLLLAVCCSHLIFLPA